MPTRRAFSLSLFGGLAAKAADWPQWRGPERTAVSEETGLADEWPAGGPPLVWKIENLGDGYGGPSVADGRVFVVANQGMDNEYLRALSAQDGSTLWTVRLGPVGNPDQQPAYPMARSTPTVDGDAVFVMSSDGDLASVQAATGEVLWRKSIREELGGLPGKWAYAESPLVDGDRVVVSPGGEEAAVAAMRKSSGEVLWKTPIEGGEAAGYASPVVAQAAGRRQYITFLDKGVIGVDARTGEALWRYDGTASGPANIPTPVVHDDLVFSSNARRFGGGAVRLAAAGGGISAEQAYFARGVPNTLGGQVLVDGVLYGSTSEGPAAANFETGEVYWQSPDGGPGSTLYADGKLLIFFEDGQAALAEATPEAYREKGRFTPPGRPPRRNGDREMSWAYPALADGRWYLRDLGVMWCYDVRA